jgi:hydrogenase maturation protease
VESAADGRFDVEVDYQLQVEHADDVARYRRVVFVDAARSGAEPFSLRRLSASRERPGFSTHSVSPESILSVSRDVFAAEPEAWLLGVRGYEFGDFGEGLSAGASRNLNAAVGFLLRRICSEESAEAGLQPAEGAPSEQRGAVR